MAICGMNTITPLNPASIPSVSKSVSNEGGRTFFNQKPSEPKASSIRSIGYVAQAKIAWKTNNIRIVKISGPASQWVSTLSSFSVKVCSFPSFLTASLTRSSRVLRRENVSSTCSLRGSNSFFCRMRDQSDCGRVRSKSNQSW